VIGKSGRHIPKERALEQVFGYTIVNDVTARDQQVRRSGGFHLVRTRTRQGIRYERATRPVHKRRVAALVREVVRKSQIPPAYEEKPR
jgi:2-keto-4-pentenoate hydratase/2-oxohepta-3-ene-1,7-dioic acid hydratase in catechol pathway